MLKSYGLGCPKDNPQHVLTKEMELAYQTLYPDYYTRMPFVKRDFEAICAKTHKQESFIIDQIRLAVNVVDVNIIICLNDCIVCCPVMNCKSA